MSYWIIVLIGTCLFIYIVYLVLIYIDKRKQKKYEPIVENDQKMLKVIDADPRNRERIRKLNNQTVDARWFEMLVKACLGDKDRANKLIYFELRNNHDLTKYEAAERAYERLENETK